MRSEEAGDSYNEQYKKAGTLTEPAFLIVNPVLSAVVVDLFF